MKRSRSINVAGLIASATVLTVVVITRFTHGAGISLLGIGLLWMVMTMVDRYHRGVEAHIALRQGDDETQVVPTRVAALVVFDRFDRTTLRALAYARATRPQSLEAVTVDVDAERTDQVLDAWEERELPVALRVLESPYRERVRPVLDYVKRLRRDRPRDVVVIYQAEYVRASWGPWRARLGRLVRDRDEEELRRELLQIPGVMVTTVPWQDKENRER